MLRLFPSKRDRAKFPGEAGVFRGYFHTAENSELMRHRVYMLLSSIPHELLNAPRKSGRRQRRRERLVFFPQHFLARSSLLLPRRCNSFAPVSMQLRDTACFESLFRREEALRTNSRDLFDVFSRCPNSSSVQLRYEEGPAETGLRTNCFSFID